MTDLTIPQLTEREARKLVAQINAKVEDIASELVRLYHGKGWAVLGYTSWRECCNQEFGKSASWACRQIKAAEARARCQLATDFPESHIRELRHLSEEDRPAALSEVNRRYGDNPTAAQVAEVVKAWPNRCPACGCTEETKEGECASCCDPKGKVADNEEPDLDDHGEEDTDQSPIDIEEEPAVEEPEEPPTSPQKPRTLRSLLEPAVVAAWRTMPEAEARDVAAALHALAADIEDGEVKP